MSISREDLKKIVGIINDKLTPAPERNVQESEKLRRFAGMGAVLETTIEAVQQHLTERILSEFGDVLNGGIEG